MTDTKVHSLPRIDVLDGSQRYAAVNAALEIIRAYCLGGNSTSAEEPGAFFDNISEYADKIQAAARES